MDEIKPGDVFEIGVKVIREDDPHLMVECESPEGGGSFFVPHKVLRTGRRLARPLGVGDRVKFKDGYGRGHTPRNWVLEAISRDGRIGLIADAGPDAALAAVIGDLEPAPAPDTKEGTCHST